MLVHHSHFTASQNAKADQLEAEARQRWTAGAIEAARQRRERHQEQLRIARVSMWGPYAEDTDDE